MNFLRTIFYYETPAEGSGGIATATPGAQPTGQGSGVADGFWGLFPDVPDEHKPLVEPHIKGMQGHITKLEQQYAPFKAFADAGVTPEAAAGLLQFSADFDTDPKGMWLKIGNMLQEGGQIPEDLDLEYLAALANGEDPDVQQAGDPVVEGQPAGDPALMQLVQELRAKVDELENGRQQEQVQRQQSIQDQLLDRQMASMKSSLTEAGYPEDAITDEMLTAQLIAARGNPQTVVKNLIDTRSSILKGFTENKVVDEELDPNGAPPTTPRSQLRARDKGDPWAGARAGATSDLRRENRASAQE